jgi:hypothetical protein
MREVLAIFLFFDVDSRYVLFLPSHEGSGVLHGSTLSNICHEAHSLSKWLQRLLRIE